jgi:hypothetical protein
MAQQGAIPGRLPGGAASPPRPLAYAGCCVATMRFLGGSGRQSRRGADDRFKIALQPCCRRPGRSAAQYWSPILRETRQHEQEKTMDMARQRQCWFVAHHVVFVVRRNSADGSCVTSNAGPHGGCVTVREMKERPSGSAIRSLIPSHCKLLSSKAMVVNVAEKSGR